MAMLFAGVLMLAAMAGAVERQAVSIPNPGFESLNAAGFAEGWIRGVAPGTDGSAEVDATVARSGNRSLRIRSATKHQAYRYVLVTTEWLKAEPETTYVLRFHVRGHAVGKCFVGVAYEGAGEHRQPLPVGDYDWQEAAFRFTTPSGTGRISVRFMADDVADGLWIDDVSLERSEVQLANIAERRPAKAPKTWYPRTPGQLPRRLVVLDVSREGPDVCALMTALQGIVNRRAPRLYLINPTNPPGFDERWLAYMKEKGYTGQEERLDGPEAVLARFRAAVRGAIVWDDALPGSRHAAWMLGSIKDSLPCSAAVARRFGLPIVEDLRGRWKRNVDAYRYVMDRHWAAMSRGLIAWEHPLSTALLSRDVAMQQRAFLFWVSSPLDGEAGADPKAEMEFAEELLARTPGNIPVMGWPMYGTKGIEEYTGVRLLSEFGKWVPGTQFTSNGTVHSAIRPPSGVFRQPSPPAPLLQTDRLYLAVSIMDSGDAHWYWQLYQQGIWADPARGSAPTGYGMNMTLVDALPLVAQWYYERRTANDTFFGLIYMNAPVFASRFRRDDRERIWADFVRRTGEYLRRLDMDGLEIYTGGTAEARPPDALLRRFTRGIPGLRFILAGLGRHADVQPDAAARMLDDTVVFDTLTNFRVWTEPGDLTGKKMEDENAWLLGEITAHAPKSRPGFMSALAISWIYYPAWLADLKSRLPPDFVMVSPRQMAELYRQAARTSPRGR